MGPSLWCSEWFFSQSQLPLYSPYVQSHASTSVRMLKMSSTGTVAAIPLFSPMKILHTLIGMGSTSHVAALPYQGMVARISHKEQRSTKHTQTHVHNHKPKHYVTTTHTHTITNQNITFQQNTHLYTHTYTHKHTTLACISTAMWEMEECDKMERCLCYERLWCEQLKIERTERLESWKRSEIYLGPEIIHSIWWSTAIRKK